MSSDAQLRWLVDRLAELMADLAAAVVRRTGETEVLGADNG
ncbi:hypothetical protein [Nocardioides dongkuii]|nr:hypothetical protein [Nocardioides dongkuii]